MDIKALQLESRFSLPPNSLGYCGRNTAADKFKQCIVGRNCKGVEEEVRKFIVLYPYLKTLSTITGLSPFSYEVIESYWLGNELLNQAKPEHYDLLLDNFLEQGVPDFFVEELRKKKPKKFIPNHLFHVLHVGVGKASGAVPFNIKTINNCMIRAGKVEEIKGNKIKVFLNLFKNNSKSHPELVFRYTQDPEPVEWVSGSQGMPKQVRHDSYMVSTIKEWVQFDGDLLGNVKVGDVVAVHWKMGIKKLNREEEKKLRCWTNIVLESLI